jgi:predicted MFS family arabinose efflux permease
MNINLSNSTLTQLIYLANRGLCSPLEALYTILIFILSKETGATVFQLTVLASVKPVVSLAAFYLSSYMAGRTRRGRFFIAATTLLGALPTVFFPLIDNPWYFIASFAVFVTAVRSAYPVWMEILKTNLSGNLSGIAAKGNALTYTLVIFVPLLCSHYMDQNPSIWKWLFMGLGLIQLLGALALLDLKCDGERFAEEKPPAVDLLFPWKKGWLLVKENADFAGYLALFFLGGAGLVAIQPILPLYFKNTLHLSYTQLTLAISLCKGIAYVFSSPLWASCSRRISLYLLNAIVNLISCLFLVFIVTASLHTWWVFVAYAFYGSMQAGCELSWNLSGPTFAKNKDSTLFSSLNLAYVGIRGCIFPFAGQLLYLHSNALVVFGVAGALCLFGIAYAFKLERSFQNDSKKIGTI